jgi:molybdopterin synthase catalytic subunit
MKVFLLLSPDPIQPLPSISDPSVGAAVTFSGLVRNTEEHRPISSLFYEAYLPMAENSIREILGQLSLQHPCTSFELLHRLGHVPVGELSLWIRVLAPHRAEAFSLLTHFLDHLKKDVPIWKTKPSP